MWPNTGVLTICAEHGVVPDIPDISSNVGISKTFDSNSHPINGLRHPSGSSACGWYVWSGEVFPAQDDGFKPLCLRHLVERSFPGLRFFGLPPGWRFLVAGSHVDVWYDPTLLQTS